MPTYRAVSSHPDHGVRRGDTRQLEATDPLVRSGLFRLVPEPEPEAESEKEAPKPKRKRKS